MKQVASEIRSHLKGLGYPARSISVRCNPNYTIKVTTKSPEVDVQKLSGEVMEVYHRRSHHWLVVWVNDHILPMPPIKEITP